MEVPGSNPADPSKLNFLVTTKWGYESDEKGKSFDIGVGCIIIKKTPPRRGGGGFFTTKILLGSSEAFLGYPASL